MTRTDHSKHSPDITPTSNDHPRDDPTLARAQVTDCARHRVLGHNVRVESNDARVIAAARAVFGPRLPDDRDSHIHEVVSRILVHAVAEDAGFSARQPLIRRQGALFSVTGGRASAVAGDSDAGFAFGFVSEQAASQAAFLREGLVLASVLCLLSPRYLTAVHAACVTRGGVAVMLRGDSGAGKTTLTYAALRGGYALLSEDALHIRVSRPMPDRLRAPDVTLVGMPWTLNLLPDARLLFPELRSAPIHERLSGERKLCVDVAERFAGQTQEEAALGPLVFVARGAGAVPRLSRVSRADALARLARTAIADEAVVDREHGLWDAFLELPVYLLETGEHPGASVALLDEIIDAC